MILKFFSSFAILTVLVVVFSEHPVSGQAIPNSDWFPSFDLAMPHVKGVRDFYSEFMEVRYQCICHFLW